MNNIPTEELEDALKNEKDIDIFLDENKDNFISDSFSDYYVSILEKNGISKADAIRETYLKDNYIYQILRGLKSNPSRNIVLQLAFGAHMNLTETNRALKLCGLSVLYPKIKRDAVIISAINNKQTLKECNLKLASLSEERVR